MTAAPQNCQPEAASTLLPCPFCGSTNIDPKGWASIDFAGPACDDCGGTADTVGIWNTRPQIEDAKGYVDRAIASYVGDPADNQFQKGYLAALEVVRDEAFTVPVGIITSLDEETEEDLRSGLSSGTRDDLSDADRAAINRYRPSSPAPRSSSLPSGESGPSVMLDSGAGETSVWAEDCSKYPSCKCDDICLDSGGVAMPLEDRS